MSTEEGYTKIDNGILEGISKEKLNGTQFRILMVVFRSTFGWNRSHFELSLGYLAKATGMHRQQIKKEIDKLIASGILEVKKESSFSSPRVIAFNKNYFQSAKRLTVSENTYTTVSENAYTTVSENAYRGVSENAYQKRNNKKNNKEILKEIYIEFTNNMDLVNALIDFEEMRNKIKKPLTERARKILLSKLDKLFDNDNDKILSLEKSILNNWQSVFELKGHRNSKTKERKVGKVIE